MKLIWIIIWLFSSYSWKINKHMVVNGFCETSCKWLDWAEKNSAIFNTLHGPFLTCKSLLSCSCKQSFNLCFMKTWCLAYIKEINLTWYKQKGVLIVIAGKKKNFFTRKLSHLLFNKIFKLYNFFSNLQIVFSLGVKSKISSAYTVFEHWFNIKYLRCCYQICWW